MFWGDYCSTWLFIKERLWSEADRRLRFTFWIEKMMFW